MFYLVSYTMLEEKQQYADPIDGIHEPVRTDREKKLDALLKNQDDLGEVLQFSHATFLGLTEQQAEDILEKAKNEPSTLLRLDVDISIICLFLLFQKQGFYRDVVIEGVASGTFQKLHEDVFVSLLHSPVGIELISTHFDLFENIGYTAISELFTR